MPFGVDGLCLARLYLPSASLSGGSNCAGAQLARGRDTPRISQGMTRVIALAFAGSSDEAMAPPDGLIEAAEATDNPYVLSFALLAYGIAFREADPVRARDALRRGLAIAQDSGNRDQ